MVFLGYRHVSHLPHSGKPHVKHVNMGYGQAGGLVLVVDEAQDLANKNVLADGIMNIFGEASSYGPIILIIPDYTVPDFLRTRVRSSIEVVFAPMATREEMLPYARARFGDQAAQKVVDAFGGAFGLLRWMDTKAGVDVGISDVRAMHKNRIVDSLDLTESGVKMADRAARTGEAMVAAAKLAFSAGEIDPFARGTLELARAGAAKIESHGSVNRASWAAPITGDIMKEVLCDGAIHATMKERIEDRLYKDFEEVIKGRCPLGKGQER